MRVLDLFSGLGGWSEAFIDRGHDVLRIDNDPRFRDVPSTLIEDVMDIGFLTGYDACYYDVVLASPPCQAFSLVAKSTHMMKVATCTQCGKRIERIREKWWHHGYNTANVHTPDPDLATAWLEPQTDFGKLSVQLVAQTLYHINAIQPKFWWMENPNGGMIHFVPTDIPRVQVTYCQYGEPNMKLTNLWGNWPDTWHPRPRCKNGAPCHERAPRGSMNGLRAKKGQANRSLVPYELSLEVCMAAERAI